MLKRFMFSQNQRLYDLIFPIFMMWLFPPILIIVLVGNFIIDGAIIFIVFRVFKVTIEEAHWLHLTKMWGLGLVVDILGTIALFYTSMVESSVYTIWNDPKTAVIFLLVVMLCGVLIGFANYHFTKKKFQDVHMAKVMGMAMGILTAPWTFLIPTSLVIH